MPFKVKLPVVATIFQTLSFLILHISEISSTKEEDRNDSPPIDIDLLPVCTFQAAFSRFVPLLFSREWFPQFGQEKACFEITCWHFIYF